MLKIKNGINLNMLEKRIKQKIDIIEGYEKAFYIDNNRNIKIQCSDSWYNDEINIAIEILYDLIKADLVEKVDG